MTLFLEGFTVKKPIQKSEGRTAYRIDLTLIRLTKKISFKGAACVCKWAKHYLCTLTSNHFKKAAIATMDKKTILWADDDADDLELFLGVLRELTSDYNIRECRNGKEVLDYLDGLSTDGYPCLIILDMNMPVLSGRDTLASLKNNTLHKDIPVVVFTTSSSDLDKRFCEHHHTEMITKPPTYDKLKDIVGRMLQFCGK